MTRGQIQQLKGLWELVFIGWLMGFVALCAVGKVDLLAAIVFFSVEIVLIVGGHWIADQDRRCR
jgi:hypothetical protein